MTSLHRIESNSYATTRIPSLEFFLVRIAAYMKLKLSKYPQESLARHHSVMWAIRIVCNIHGHSTGLDCCRNSQFSVTFSLSVCLPRCGSRWLQLSCMIVALWVPIAVVSPNGSCTLDQPGIAKLHGKVRKERWSRRRIFWMKADFYNDELEVNR